MTPEGLLALFDDVAAAVRGAVHGIAAARRRDRTERAGQYALDLVADAAALEVLSRARVQVLSEESGLSGPASDTVVVLDPVDGSTNCARGISYWSTSICALQDGLLVAALVVNQATGQRVSAVRDRGAERDGETLTASRKQRVEESVVGLGGLPVSVLPWRQTRSLGCASLALCEVAAGGLDGYVDGAAWHAPWDYLGGYLACVEAGAKVRDAAGHDLVDVAATARRQIVAAGTAELLEALLPAAGAAS